MSSLMRHKILKGLVSLILLLLLLVHKITA
jgi:hypothetical protein